MDLTTFTTPADVDAPQGTGTVRAFMDKHFLHFNSRETVAAARAFEAHIDAGGKMMVTLAGAMSTAKLGQILARLIRADKVHAITCTGANLEEDLFNLLAYNEYEIIHDWRALSAADETALYERGMNRVTDTCIPETVMRHMERQLIDRWKQACDNNERKFEHEFLWDIFRDGKLEKHYQIDPANSWMLAAMEKNLPVYCPGWEDSTTGNMFAAAVFRKELPHHQCVKTGTEAMEHLMRWYLDNCGIAQSSNEGKPSVGFFQVGGGIAGDFPICAVPAIIQDLQRDDVPYWAYFAQISDAVTSYGGYSGAVPNEKITWGKLDAATPKFMIQSDATIVAPLIFAYVLGD
ncbi:deoxyhypusine synthase family protein [Phycisphaerales bacterium AB-hyl4]|uniref:Deoxyhypusine synthase family protein n=1 Tax=Natronomicrosphaera hydrolytica TaxID=3242702 RepID=A0ABV4U3L6_9BACT